MTRQITLTSDVTLTLHTFTNWSIFFVSLQQVSLFLFVCCRSLIFLFLLVCLVIELIGMCVWCLCVIGNITLTVTHTLTHLYRISCPYIHVTHEFVTWLHCNSHCGGKTIFIDHQDHIFDLNLFSFSFVRVWYNKPNKKKLKRKKFYTHTHTP